MSDPTDTDGPMSGPGEEDLVHREQEFAFAERKHLAGAEGAAGTQALNSQIVEAVAAVTKIAQDAQGIADGALAQVMAQGVAMAMLNAVNAQQNAYLTANATVAASVTRILSVRQRPIAPPSSTEAPHG